MSNEKFIEEIFHSAHYSGVLNEFHVELEKRKKTNPNLHYHNLIEEVYYDFVLSGDITSTD
jgi:hypothetical protein